MRPLAVLACLLPGFLAAPAHAVEAGDPASRLDAMSRSFRSLDYQGVFTYEQGQSLSSVRIAHAVVDGVEQERLVHLDGEQREFVRRGHRVDCEHAGDRLMRLDPAARFAQRAQSGVAGAQLGDHYAIEFDGAERVANHRGQRIRIVPRDPYRYGVNVVLDEASSLLLKSETTDGAGRVLERFQFVDLQIGAPSRRPSWRPRRPARSTRRSTPRPRSPHPSRGRLPGCRRDSSRRDARCAAPAPAGQRSRSRAIPTGWRCSRSSSSAPPSVRLVRGRPRAAPRCPTSCRATRSTWSPWWAKFPSRPRS